MRWERKYFYKRLIAFVSVSIYAQAPRLGWGGLDFQPQNRALLVFTSELQVNVGEKVETLTFCYIRSFRLLSIHFLIYYGETNCTTMWFIMLH